MVARPFVVLLLSFSGLLHGADCTLRMRENTGGAVVGMAVSSNESLSEQDAIRCFDAFVAQETTTPRLLRLVIYADESDAASYKGKGFQGAAIRSWDEWLKRFEAAPRPRHAMAEVVQSPMGVVLRYRSETGRISKSVLRGRDPTLIRTGNSSFAIVHFVMMGPAPIFASKPGGGMRLDFYLQTTEVLRESDCLRVAQDLSTDLEVPWIIAVFRHDPFFIMESAFPLRFPLVELPPLPTEQEYFGSGEMFCVVQYGESWCGVSPTPGDRE